MSLVPICIQIRPWALAQADALPVREAVFVHEQGVSMALERDEFDAVALHAVAYDIQGAALGTGRLLADGHIGRMAVIQSARGTGVGGQLLAALVGEARRQGMSSVILNAQCHARGFYAAHGFSAEGPVFKDAGIDHVTMTQCLQEQGM